MKKNDSLYQLLLSIALVILGTLCFIPNVNFLQLLIFLIGLIITIIGLFIFIRGLTKEFENESNMIVILSGIFITIIGVCFSTLVWLLFSIFAIALGSIFILYSILGLYLIIKDKYGITKIRLLNGLKNLIYLFVGILIIVDCFYHNMIIDIILGVFLLSNGLIGILAYIQYYKEYHSIIESDEIEIQEYESIIIDEED